LVKKTALEEYVKISKKSGIVAINIRENDELASVNLVKDEQVMIITKKGMAIRFNSNEIGATSRNTSGVKGINLNEGDEVIATLPIRNDTDSLAVFSSNGLGKKTALNEFPVQKRAGKGIVCYKASDINAYVSAATLIEDEDNILVCGDKGSLCVSAADVPLLSRGSSGNQIIKGSKILSVSKV
jgi:DNA gyrase subunit A